MNLIDAIKSGKPFRRGMPDPAMRNLNEWCGPLDPRLPHFTKLFMVSDILANDWEIQEPTVTITKTQFWNAACAAMKQEYGKKQIVWPGSQQDLIEKLTDSTVGFLAMKLGLEDDK